MLERLWAKSTGERLTEHTLHVLNTLGQLALRHEGLEHGLGSPRLWYRLFWAAVLHDLGKAASGFQAMLRKGAPWHQRHEVLSTMFLPLVAGVGSNDHPWIAAFILSHHRDGAAILSEYDPDAPDYHTGLGDLAADLSPHAFRALVDWLRSDVLPLVRNAPWLDRGVQIPDEMHPDSIRETLRAFGPTWAEAAMRDALRAYRRLRAACEADEPLGALRREALVGRGLIMLADRLASAHAFEIDLRPRVTDEDLRRRTGIRVWNAHQRAVVGKGLQVRLQAATGSGKTEASLRWALHGAWEAGNLIYLLPFQASLNAMLHRLRSALNADVGLIHGHSLQALYQTARGEYAPLEAQVRARRDNDLARLYRPAVWLTTPYHLLRAAYGLPGHATTWAALQQSALILDEMHAYEPIRMGMILALLRLMQDRCVCRHLKGNRFPR
ncbi:MAG: CRISPR-associated endonuclease Cas3'' [Chloroflexi bacterium]|nr:CRISPR-associated endonuclease Cas3'' [Chloroflexota bacterium]